MRTLVEIHARSYIIIDKSEGELVGDSHDPHFDIGTCTRRYLSEFLNWFFFILNFDDCTSILILFLITNKNQICNLESLRFQIIACFCGHVLENCNFYRLQISADSVNRLFTKHMLLSLLLLPKKLTTYYYRNTYYLCCIPEIFRSIIRRI